jgi:hypothetical protein
MYRYSGLAICLFTLAFMVNLSAQSPVWQWAKKAGGPQADYCYSIAADNAGNKYITGCFSGTAAFGSTTLTGFGMADIYVAKIDGEGNWLWAKKAGGVNDDYGYSIVVDNADNIYVTGYFKATAAFGSTNLTSNGEEDIFVAKLDNNGNWLWAYKAGGTSNDVGNNLAVDNVGNVFIAGYFGGSIAFGSTNLTSSGGLDVFVCKMDTNGNWLWAKRGGGEYNEWVSGVSVDSSGNVIVTGAFCATATFNNTSLTVVGFGDTDNFIVKLDTGGSWLWVKQTEGPGYWDGCLDIATDNEGFIYITGGFYDTITFGTITLTSSGATDVYVAKMDSSGNWLWARRGGGTEGSQSSAIVIGSNNIYITGDFNGSASFGSSTVVCIGNADTFVAELDASGNWIWAKRGGGVSSEDIDVDAEGFVYTTGTLWGNNATDTFDSITITGITGYDIFVAKLGNVVGINDDLNAQTTDINVLAASPNPFSLETTIRYNVKNSSLVNIAIYNLKGEKVRTLVSENKANGFYKTVWNGRDDNGNAVSSGVYLYRMQADGMVSTQRMLLVK